MADLYRAGIAKLIDSDAIAIYVRTLATWRQADALVAAAGVLIKDRDGDARRNPALLAARQFAEETRRWMVEFGLTGELEGHLPAVRPAR